MFSKFCFLLDLRMVISRNDVRNLNIIYAFWKHTVLVHLTEWNSTTLCAFMLLKRAKIKVS